MDARIAIAWRFALYKRRPMLLSLAGVVVGVALFIVTQAQTAGFERFFVRTILGANGAIRVQDRFQANRTTLTASGTGAENAGFQVPLREGRTYVSGIEYPGQVMEAIRRFESVSAASEVLAGGAEATSGFRTEPVNALGVRMEDHAAVSDLRSQLRQGSLERFAQDDLGILVGARLAERLVLDLGDPVVLDSGHGPIRFRVSGIFESGVGELDLRRTFVHLHRARVLFEKPFGSSYLQLALHEPGEARSVAAHIEEAVRHDTDSWQEREKTWLEVFRALRLSSAITVSAIILIAGLGMFNTLAIIVMERGKEIAILRSMGYTRLDIAWVFLAQGMIVWLGGVLLGWAAGALATWGIGSIPIHIRGIFSTDRFVVAWSGEHYAWAALISAAVVLVASWIPARRAARIEPGEVIRGLGG